MDGIYQSLVEWLISHDAEGPVLLCGHSDFTWDDFLKRIQCRVVCEMPNDDEPCLKCPACKQVISQNHPDIITLESEEAIKLQDVHDVLGLLRITSLSGKRIVVIKHAESLLHEAANALLKQLEESSEHTRILLTTSYPRRILPTIRSRCRIMRVSVGGSMHLSNEQEARQSLDTFLSRTSKQALTEEELSDIGVMLTSTLHNYGVSPLLYRAMLRFRDCYKVRSQRGGNDKLASDVLLASLVQLRDTNK